MEEKERYIIDRFDEDIFDTKKEYYPSNQTICEIINQQDKRIKELEQENRELHTAINLSIPNQIAMKDEIERLHTCVDNRIDELEKENQQLKQQLHDLPKKIVEYFYDEIRHRAILEDDYCPDHNLERKYGVRKCLLENIRTTILKKYGDKNE